MNLPLLLAVDDERGVRESVKMVFYKDYRLLEAESVDVAIRQVQEEKPQVVLLDVLMPKTDGIEILRQIKRIHPTCEVIMLTGVNSQQLAAKGFAQVVDRLRHSEADCHGLVSSRPHLTRQENLPVSQPP